MKLKISITAIIIALFFAFTGIWDAIKSPVTGAATAAQLDDTLQSYIVAHGVSQNFVENTIGLVCASLILIIWLIPAKKKI